MSLRSVVARLPGPLQDRLRQWHYLRKLRSASWMDEDELGAVRSLVRSGQTVIDIGANFGLYTRFLSEAVGPEGRVFAFEPTRDMFRVLESSCRSLRLDNVVTCRLALSDSCGEAIVRIPRREDGTLNHYEASIEAAEASASDGRKVAEQQDAIRKRSLDDYCSEQGIESVDFIKCDVEGHEIPVLRGASRLIRRSRPLILIEVNDSLDESAHGRLVGKLVEDLDYEFQVFEHGKMRPRGIREQRVNYVLSPKAEETPAAV